MGVKIIIWMALLIVAAVIVSDAKEKSCKSIQAEYTKKQLKGMQACARTLKYKSPKEKRDKAACILKCVLVTEKVLVEPGIVPPGHMEKFIEEQFPEFLRERANTTFSPCMSFTEKFDPDDPFCKTYDPFIKCLIGQLGNFCKGM